MAKAREADSSLIYQVKAVLKNVRPPIWRRIQVPGDMPLHKLHSVIQTVMGWEDYHLHQFTIAGVEYGVPDPEGDVPWGEPLRSDRSVKLRQVLGGEGSKFSYLYDFGDGWNHELLIEKILPPQEGVRYPVCIAGKRACPPEDCGGAWGYEEFLEAIQDPSHKRHEELLDWIGGSFDPEEFESERINRKLRSLR